MAREICILEGNCQADAFYILLRNTPAFDRLFEIRRTVNYQKQTIPDSLMENCRLYLYQHLGAKWKEFSTESQLRRLPGNARTMCIPNMFFTGYWPFWQNIPDVIEFGDSLLETLLAKGLSNGEILRLYCRCPPALAGQPEENVMATLKKEREKEHFTPVKYVRLIEEYWRERQTFLTINHPGEFLLLHAANEILKLLGLGPLPKDIAARFEHPHGEFYLPIHPVPARILGLPFASPGRKYPCFAHSLNYEEFAAYYLACRGTGVVSMRAALS